MGRIFHAPLPLLLSCRSATFIPPTPTQTNTKRAANSAVLRLLEPLRDFCLTRHEGYWSYEFCYKRGIRQYHNVAVRDPKGAWD